MIFVKVYENIRIICGQALRIDGIEKSSHTHEMLSVFELMDKPIFLFTYFKTLGLNSFLS